MLGTLGAEIADPRRFVRQEEAGQVIQESRFSKAVADRRKKEASGRARQASGCLRSGWIGLKGKNPLRVFACRWAGGSPCLSGHHCGRADNFPLRISIAAGEKTKSPTAGPALSMSPPTDIRRSGAIRGWISWDLGGFSKVLRDREELMDLCP